MTKLGADCGRDALLPKMYGPEVSVDSELDAPYTRSVLFRDRLLATIAAARTVLEEPGVLVVGSEVPNLLERDAASTLVVSQDLDIGVPVAEVNALLHRLEVEDVS